MIISRRRRPMDYYYSSCSSSNKKRVDLLVRRPRHCSRARATTKEDGDEDSSPASACTGKSSEMLLKMAEMGGGRRMRSSIGSCTGGSMGSLKDHRPSTPSPVCSPVRFRSTSPPTELPSYSHVSNAVVSNFAPPNHQNCVISNDAKESTSPEEVEEAEGREAIARRKSKKASNVCRHPNKRSQMQKRRVAGEVYSNQAYTPNANHMPPRRFSHEPIDSSEGHNHDNGRRLPIVSEEVDQRVDTKNWHTPTMSSLLFSDGAYYMGISSSASVNDSSGDDNNVITDPLSAPAQRGKRGFHSPVTQGRSDMEAKLIAWKEGQMLKLINKLRKQEVAIEEWERKQITKAKQDMIDIETKLEKELTKVMNKMQRKILITQKKAEKKKLKEQAAANQKISDVTTTFEKISRTGKLPWKPICY